MSRAFRIALFVGLIAADVIGGERSPAEAVDARPLGETATRLPGGRIATSVEGGHSCMVVADSTVRCWGLNAFGQLGDGTTTTPAASVRVTGISSAIGVTPGRDHSCALLADATVRCWGTNSVGQLGSGSTTSSFAPVTVSGITDAVSISGGSLHTCARRSNGTVACWGSNQFGQLGDNSFTHRSAPVPVQGISNARMVAVGSTHTCAVRADGTVACWGGNGVGQLGRGAIGGDFAAPATVPPVLRSSWRASSMRRDRSGAVSYMRRPRHRGAPLLGAQRLPAARGRHDAGSAEPRHRSRGRIRRGRRRGGRADVHVHPHCSGQRSVLGRQQPRRARRRHLRRSARARVRSATASLRDSGNQWRGRAGRGQHSRLRRRCQRATGVLGQ